MSDADTQLLVNTRSQIKPAVAQVLSDYYDGSPIDDYCAYHPEYGEPYDQFFGSVVYAMTPLGDTAYFRVTQRPDQGDYRVRLIDLQLVGDREP